MPGGLSPETALASQGANVNPSEKSSYAFDQIVGVCTEYVHFTGEVRMQIHWADPPSNATTSETFHVKSRLHGIRGEGLTSGDSYRLLGQQGGTFGPASFGTNGERISTVIKQRYIRAGTGKVAEVTSTFHLVVNRNGVIVDRYETTAECL
jgi:hypothetical protein